MSLRRKPLDILLQSQNLQNLGCADFSGQPDAAAAAAHTGEGAVQGSWLAGCAGSACNHLIAFAGCTDLAEWAVSRLQSAVWQDSPRL
jgi:hypothetical protein